MPKKNFKDDVAGADKLFSANDVPSTEIIETDILSNASGNIIANDSNNKYPDILNNVKKVEEVSGKTCAIYLSSEVLGAVNAAVKEKNVSRSKLINSILKQVLLGEV